MAHEFVALTTEFGHESRPATTKSRVALSLSSYAETPALTSTAIFLVSMNTCVALSVMLLSGFVSRADEYASATKL